MSTRILRSVTLLSTLLSTLLLPACDTGDDHGAQSVREAVAAASITLTDAIAIATTGQQGVLVEAELEVEDTTPIYEVRILDAGTLTKIHVHPDTGMVLGKELEDDADKIADATVAAELLAGATIDAAAAIASAEAERPGSIAFEFEARDGRIEVEVAADAGLFEIYLDPATGAVTHVDVSDDDHVSGSDDDASDDDDSPDDNGVDTASDSPDDHGNDTASDSPDDNGNDTAEAEDEADGGKHGGDDDDDGVNDGV